MKTPTEVQADMIRELEAKVSLLLDDLFYARAEIAKMPSDIYLCPPTSENDYEGLKWCEAYEELERENAELETTLKLVYDANQRGIKAWQQAHPDKAMVWPDQAKLVEWLVRENAALRADKERLDWIIGKAHYLFFKDLGSDLAKGREQIDAARKEAQP